MSDIITVEAKEIVVSDTRNEIEDTLRAQVVGHTREAYSQAIREFHEYWSKHDEWGAYRTLAEWLKYQHEEIGLQPSTVNKKRIGIRRFFEVGMILGHVSPDLFAQIKEVPAIKKSGKKAGKWITLTQMQTMLNGPDRNTIFGKRDRAVLALLMGSMLRRSEVQAMKWEQLQQYGDKDVWNFVNVKRKHGRIQAGIPCPLWVKTILDDYREALEEDSEYIVQRHDRYGNAHGRLSNQSIYNIVKKYTSLLDISISPHDLRRSAARAAFEAGCPMTQLQHILGHESIKTTERYVNDELDMEEAVNYVELEV